MDIQQLRVGVFGYGGLGATALRAVAEAGAAICCAVAPGNRKNDHVRLFVDAAAAAGAHVLYQPPRQSIGSFLKEFRAFRPTLGLICSYTMILPPELLAIPPLGFVNAHGGLLPEYRGGHVLQWAIINGETETGVTLHEVDAGIDTGPIIGRRLVPIRSDEHAVAVQGRLGIAAAEVIREYLPRIAAGTAPRTPQDESRARYHRLRSPADGLIAWERSALEITNLVRALATPWPGAFTYWEDRRVVVREAAIAPGRLASAAPGTVLAFDTDGAQIATGGGVLCVRVVESGGVNLRAKALQSGLPPVGERFVAPVPIKSDPALGKPEKTVA